MFLLTVAFQFFQYAKCWTQFGKLSWFQTLFSDVSLHFLNNFGTLFFYVLNRLSTCNENGAINIGDRIAVVFQVIIDTSSEEQTKQAPAQSSEELFFLF